MSETLKTADGRCYVCKGRIGVFRWTDFNGSAHPWCATGESWDWAPDSSRKKPKPKYEPWP